MDNLNLRGQADQARINIHEEWEVRRWSEKFGVTPAQLRAAVQAVGPMAKDVARHLGKPF
jgi:hypothetical protein